jgi:alkyldihydroxyacetonephosphate synthase
LKWQGWGYRDSRFFLNSNGLIEFSGSRYHLSGHVLPRLKDWMSGKLNANIENYSPGVQQPNPDYIPVPILNQAFIADFQSILGSTVQYSSDMHDRLFHGHGHTLEEIWKLRTGGKFDRLPDWIIWPRGHADVEKLVSLATKHNVCLIPFGGGTSVTWALLCPSNEHRMIVSVDTSQMNNILYLDEKNLTARIQSGIIGQDLERELGKKGMVVFIW